MPEPKKTPRTPPAPSSAAARRFFETAEAVVADGGWTVSLDGRTLATPGRAAFLAPEAVARAAAAEWAAQEAVIRPDTMPVTRAVNTAIERIAPARARVIDEIAAYAQTDAICHRAGEPADLAALEAAVWDPLLDWAETRYAAPLKPTTGLRAAEQDAGALASIRGAVASETDLGLAALWELTTLSGSVVIALAVRDARLSAEDGWRASRLHEDHQIALWGEDAEAAAAAVRSRSAFLEAAALRRLLDQS